jgi:putative MFS transporter
MAASTADGADTLRRELDKLAVSRLHILILVACALGFTFDLAEITLGSVLPAIFSAPPNPMNGTQLAWVLVAERTISSVSHTPAVDAQGRDHGL